MGFWERLREWLGRKPVPTLEETSNTGPIESQPATRPVTKPSMSDTLPTPGQAAVDVFKLLFSNKDKHIATMFNSISLSSDMKTLYLIDNGRAIPFDLTVPQGVLVGLLGGQLVVATALGKPLASDTPIDPDGPNIEGEITGGRRPVPESEKFAFKAGENSQYTLSYNGKNKALGIIGVDDIVIHLEAPDDAVCTDKVFSLANKKVINIRWERDELQIIPVSGK